MPCAGTHGAAMAPAAPADPSCGYDDAQLESLVVLQRSFRGLLARKALCRLLGASRGVEDNPAKQMLPPRKPGHPSDRELLAKARFLEAADFARRNLIDESSYDGASQAGQEQLPDVRRLITPLPLGVEGQQRVKITELHAAELAFQRLDDTHEGALDRMRSRMWFRCMGWVASNDQLDRMLSGATPENPNPRRRYGYNLWTLKNLMEIAEANEKGRNGSVEELVAALRRLSNGKQRISQNRLVEVTAAHSDFLNDGIGEIFGLLEIDRPRTIDIEAVAQKVLGKICDPPPSLDRYAPKGCA